MTQEKPPKKRRLPQALVEEKAHKLWQVRIAEGKAGNSEADWEAARQYLQKHPKEVFIWRVKKGLILPCQWLRGGVKKLRTSLFSLLRLVWQWLTFPFWLFKNYLPPLFANVDSRDYAMDVVKAIISGLTLIGTAIAAIGLFLSYSQNQERLITERFSKAVEQLGAVNSISKRKEETVRIGGIYSLERIAKDSPKDHWTIMEVLTSYAREESPIVSIQGKAPPVPDWYSSPDEPEKKKWDEWIEKNKVTIDVQAALTAIGRRNDDNDNYSNWIGAVINNLSKIISLNQNRDDPKRVAEAQTENIKYLDLNKSNLTGANLDGANLNGANLDGAILDGAYLIGANLIEANLIGANLYRAILTLANLYRATLIGANLIEANLDGANLYRAYLIGANLEGANLEGAYLEGATLIGANLNEAFLKDVENLTPAQIKSACNWEEAIYKGDWDWSKGKAIVNKVANQKYIESLKQDKTSNRKKPVDCSQWK